MELTYNTLELHCKPQQGKGMDAGGDVVGCCNLPRGDGSRLSRLRFPIMSFESCGFGPEFAFSGVIWTHLSCRFSCS